MPADRKDLVGRLRVSLGAEIDQQVRALADDLLSLEKDPTDSDRLRAVFRVFHTLKGAARAAGIGPVERLCHLLEDRLVPIRDGSGGLDRTEVNLLLAAADALRTTVPGLERGESPDTASIEHFLDQVQVGHAPVQSRRETSPARPASAPTPARTAPRGHVRIETGRLDDLLGDVGDLIVSGARLQDALREQAAHQDRLAAWAFAWRRWSARWQQTGTASDVRALADLSEQMRQLVRDGAAELRRTKEDFGGLATAHDRLARGIHRLRLEPFGSVCDALPRVVRDLALDGTRQVELVIEGADVTADRTVLETLRDPLMQLLRNAVDHGIEAPSIRRERGKPATGTVTISASLHHDRLVVEVRDDGAGLDIAALRAAAHERGLQPGADDRAVVDLLLGVQGISSRREATDISGRGVGLDIVRTAVARLGGIVHIDWVPGQGTTFRLDLPLSLALRRAVIVRVGSHPVAIPVRFVERLVRVRPEDIEEVQGRPVLATTEGVVPLAMLADLLGPPYQSAAPIDTLPAVVVSAAGRRVALAVDALVEERELVVRLLDVAGGDTALSGGVSQLPDGSIAPVLRIPQVLAVATERPGGPIAFAAEADERTRRQRILVVDDSITTRTLEHALLEAAGYEVESTVDGAEAWRILQERGADLVVADVEMPRMDGFALCEAIRASVRFRELPVILVTARESPEDQARGLESGATAYLGKSSFDQRQLLDVVAELLG